MSMLDGWIGEQVSTDHTVIPALSGSAGSAGAAFSAAPNTASNSNTGSKKPTSSDSVDRSGPKATKVLASGALVIGLGVGGFFAWPYVAELLEPEPPAQLAMVEDNRAPTQTLTIDGDTMYLEGMVPDEAASLSFEEAATELLGSTRVVNNFVVSDEAVYDPNEPVQLQVAETVQFGTGRADITDQYQPLIDLAVELMTTRDSISLTVIGHADNVGDDETNLRLSVERAQRTADEIAGQGVDSARITVDGRGEVEPIASNDTPEGRQANRRVEFSVIGLLG